MTDDWLSLTELTEYDWCLKVFLETTDTCYRHISKKADGIVAML